MRKINTRNFRLATRTTSRDINRQIALNLIRELQPISRAELARKMGVRRGVVTTLISELIASSLVCEGATSAGQRGRRPTPLYLRTDERLALAVDIRASRTYLMLGGFDGRPIAMDSFPTVTEPDRLIRQLASRIGRMLRPDHVGKCEGIGLVVPGMVNRATGRVLNAPQLGWRDVDVRDTLAARTRLPVEIENASVACGLAKMWLGRDAGEETEDFVYVTVSDGIGTAVVVGGQVVRGHTHTAGEFGHTLLSLDGPRCLCGRQGCWEAYASNLATVARYLGRPLRNGVEGERTHARPDQRALTVPDVITRARGGDARALAAIRATGRYLGLGFATVINGLNPARIYVGGEITEAWDTIEPEFRRAVAERTLTGPAAETPITPDATPVSPRLLGGTALVAAPRFAAPRIA